MHITEKTTELKNCKIVDVEKGKLFPENTRIVLEGNRIVLGNKCESLHIDKTIDLKGMYLCPAMINTHSHEQLISPTMLFKMDTTSKIKKHTERQQEQNMRKYLEYGVTNVRDAIALNLASINKLIRKIESQKIPGPRIYKSVNVSPLGGTFAKEPDFFTKIIFTLFGMAPLSFDDINSGIVATAVNADEKELRNAVEVAIKRGADYIKIYGDNQNQFRTKNNATTYNTDQLKIVVDEAHKNNMCVHMHQLTMKFFHEGLLCGVDSLAHIPTDRLFTKTDIEMMRETDTMIEPTLSISFSLSFPKRDGNVPDNARWLDKIRKEVYQSLGDEYWVPELKESYIHHFEKAFRHDFKMMGFVNMKSVFDITYPVVTIGMDNVKILIQEGLSDRIAFGNDGGAIQLPGCSKEMEFEMLKKCYSDLGISAKNANKELLRIFTVNSAKSMKIDDRFGSIGNGKIADLVILEENPLENIDVIKKKVNGLFLNGQRVI